MEQVSLQLFVRGRTARAVQMAARVEELLAERVDGPASVEVVDVLEQPELAEQERILATPTLLRRSPPPPRRVIGDIADAAAAEELLAYLLPALPAEA